MFASTRNYKDQAIKEGCLMTATPCYWPQSFTCDTQRDTMYVFSHSNLFWSTVAKVFFLDCKSQGTTSRGSSLITVSPVTQSVVLRFPFSDVRPQRDHIIKWISPRFLSANTNCTQMLVGAANLATTFSPDRHRNPVNSNATSATLATTEQDFDCF